MLLSPEVEMQTVNNTQALPVSQKAAIENATAAAAGKGSPTLVSLVVDSEQGVNVTYLNLTITTSGQGPSQIASLEPLPPAPDPALNATAKEQATTAVAKAPAVEEKDIIIAAPSPEVEIASVAAVQSSSEILSPVSEPAIEEAVVLEPPVPEKVEQNVLSNDAFVRLVPFVEAVAPAAEVVQQTPPPSPPPPSPPPPPLPTPDADQSTISPSPLPETEPQQIIYLPYATYASPTPEGQPAPQASPEELTERISQSLSDISDTIYGITNVLQVASGN